MEKPKIVVGDGAKLCYNTLQRAGITLTLAPRASADAERLGRGPGGGGAGRPGRAGQGRGLVPVYHRLSQAERERLAREETKQ